MDSLTLKYKIRFDISVATPVIKFSDLIQDDYADLYGYTLANIKGIIKITSPIGVIYANAGFATDNFGAPDTKGASTAVWEKSVNLPLDTNGNVVKGAYTVQYKISVDGSTKFIEDSLTYNFQFVTPTAVLTPTADILKSRLTVVDATSYAVEGVSPVNDIDADRLQTVRFPITSGQANQTSANASFAVPGNMWSGTYQMKVETPATYEMQAWSDGDAQVDVVTEIIGETSMEAGGDDCACLYYACMYAIEEKYVTAKINGNLREAERLMSVRNDLDFYHNMATLAITCGEDQSIWCEKIQNLAQSENCMCPEDSGDTSSVEIIPVSTPPSGGGSSTNQWTSSASNPSSEAGSDNDFHINETTGNVFKKLSGTWTIIYNMKGAAGSAGDDAQNVIYTFIGESKSSGTSEMDLASYTMDNTPNPIMSATGDMLKISTTIKLAQNDNGKRIKLYFGGIVIAEYFTDADIDSTNDKLLIEAQITKRASNIAGVKTLITRGGNPGILKGLSMTIALSVNLHADLIIKVTGQNSVSGLGEITCNELLVEHIKYQEDVVSDDASITPQMKQQGFTATASQTEFTVTDFNLNDNFAVFVSGALQTTGRTRSGNTVIFSVGLDEGTEVVIIN